MWIERVGAGPPLVMVHGWAMHGGIFAPLRDVLAQRFCLHLIDLPGHGHSPEREGPLQLRDIAIGIAEAVPGAIWLGWSLGGLLALEAALERPLHLRGLVLLAASPRFVVGPDWPHAVDAGVFETFGRELGADWRGTLERFLALECHGSDRARVELRALRAQLFARGEPALHVLEDGLRWLSDSDLREALPEIAHPALWIAGARDRLVPWQAMQAAARRMPRGEFIAIDGGGHAPFIGHPQRVLHALDHWLGQHFAA